MNINDIGANIAAKLNAATEAMNAATTADGDSTNFNQELFAASKLMNQARALQASLKKYQDGEAQA
jgi:hypothetical protein